jgi:hypothetical protein
MQELTQEACERTIRDGEVPESVRSTSERVAVVFTQSWCPQWSFMRRYLETMDEPGLTVYFVEYDRQPFFHEMMAFKETVFGNYEVPYVRYYRDGKLVAQSNLVFLARKFLKMFNVKR